MKKISLTLLIIILIISGCGKKDTEINNKPLQKRNINSFTNASFFKVNSMLKNKKSRRINTYSVNQIISNANAFRQEIIPEKNKLPEGIYIPKLTMKQAKYLLEHGTSEWCNIALKISIKCRNLKAGNYFFENVYKTYKLTNKPLSGIGSLWGEFLMRHGKGEKAIEILDMTINDSTNNNEDPESIAVAMNDKVNTYNAMRDFKNALIAAEDNFEHSLMHINSRGMNWQLPISAELYFRELYNNEMFDKGLSIYYQYKDKLNTKEGKLNNWENTWVERFKKKYKIKYTAHGYGALAK